MLYRRPLHEVADWPDEDVRLIEQFLAIEPAAEVRMEAGIATLAALYASAHRTKGKKPPDVDAFMPFLKAWDKPKPIRHEYTDADRSLFLAFGGVTLQ